MKANLMKRYIPSDRDYKKDFKSENGRYFHTCSNCDMLFIGHKRRPNICNICKDKIKEGER